MDAIALLERAYRMFNDRDVDGLLALMTDDVEWPNVAAGTVLHGKEEIREYWRAQWEQIDSRVTPTDFLAAGDDLVAVVDQRILALDGTPLLPPSVVYHRHTFADALVRRMRVFDDRSAALAP